MVNALSRNWATFGSDNKRYIFPQTNTYRDLALRGGFSIRGPFRLRLLYHLVVRPRTPTELASLENKHLSDVSRGLSLLRKDGLVRCESTGARERYYKLTQEGYILLYASMRQGR